MEDNKIPKDEPLIIQDAQSKEVLVKAEALVGDVDLLLDKMEEHGVSTEAMAEYERELAEKHKELQEAIQKTSPSPLAVLKRFRIDVILRDEQTREFREMSGYLELGPECRLGEVEVAALGRQIQMLLTSFRSYAEEQFVFAVEKGKE